MEKLHGKAGTVQYDCAISFKPYLARFISGFACIYLDKKLKVLLESHPAPEEQQQQQQQQQDGEQQDEDVDPQSKSKFL